MFTRTAAAILLVSCAVGAQPIPTEKQAKIQRLLSLTDQQFDFSQLWQQLKSVTDLTPMPDTSPEVRAKVEATQKKMMESMQRFLTSEKMRALQVQAYDDVYTSEEIDGILAFYESAAGAALRKKSPILQQRLMVGMQELMAAFFNETMSILKETTPQ